ncbi:MAG: hypothetical protein AABX91_00370 [Nanoarchaeota archaeon]
MAETILQHWVFTQFIFPFLLIFFIAFGVLEKSKIFGQAKQLNAGIAFVIGLIFVGAIFPKLVVGNLILFLTIALVTMFVALLLWGFVAGDTLKFNEAPAGLRYFIGLVIVIATVAALLWALGVQGIFFVSVYDFVFKSGWSKDFWTNASFVVVVIAALALVLKPGK